MGQSDIDMLGRGGEGRKRDENPVWVLYIIGLDTAGWQTVHNS